MLITIDPIMATYKLNSLTRTQLKAVGLPLPLPRRKEVEKAGL